MKARINTKTQLAWFYRAGTPSNVSAKVYDATGTLLVTVPLVPSTTLSNLYLSTGAIKTVNFTRVGTYTVRYLTGTTVLQTEVVDVGMDPVSDIELSFTEPQVLYVTTEEVGASDSARVGVKILKADDTLIEDVPADYDAITGNYKATASAMSGEGTYCAIWYNVVSTEGGDVTTIVAVRLLQALVPRNFELVQFFIGQVPGPSVPYQDTKLLLSKASDGVPVVQGVTSSTGYCSLRLPPDLYIATLAKDGVVFNVNNFSIEVVDSTISFSSVQSLVAGKIVDAQIANAPGTNVFDFITGSFVPTFDPESSAVSVCKLFAKLFSMTGKPVANSEIRVSLLQRPQNFSGNAVMDTAMVLTTDKNGYVEFDIVQGAMIEVVVMSQSMRRTFVVPSGADADSPVNLMSLMSVAPDPFDIVKETIPAAPRRTI